MKTNHLLVATFSMGLIIILISNTGLAFGVVHPPQYNQGYNSACTDVKHGTQIWDDEGTIWDGFDDKYGALQNNTAWMQGYRDGAICNHTQSVQYDAGFHIGCLDKKEGKMRLDPDSLLPIVPNGHNQDWSEGYYDAGGDTSFCHTPTR